ncbi:MAG: ABC transporter permease [Firmicutes bacterium]|mgnify:CR=1 FL=1|nr:ABC transporter permease [Bacillota bacterium]
MKSFVIRRLLYMIPTIIVISIICFTLIQLPPGDYLSSYIAKLAASGEGVDEAVIAGLRHQYGLDQPFHKKYFKWIWGVLHGNLGYSFEWNQPVSELVGERLALTLIVSTASLFFAWVVALPIGVFSAVRQYSVFDYIATFFGFIGLATPNFLLALILMYLGSRYLNISVGGLFSPEFVDAPWNLARFIDLLKHLWIPMIVIGMAGTAELIRVTRANLLDELSRPYVETARVKGLSEFQLILKYPVRVALNPFISSIGFVFPTLISGETITAVVLNLPTTGPLLLRALLSQDMYLAGSFLLILAVLTVVGMLLSDILLALLDPRVRYD